MSAPFRKKGRGIRLALSDEERAVLRTIPEALARLGAPGADPAAARLHPAAYPDDPAADAEYRDMVATDLAKARADDRGRFTETLGRTSMSDDDAQVWLRVLGDARLVLASRMGIEHEQWEEDRSLAESRDGAMLHYLSYLQDALIAVLSTTL